MTYANLIRKNKSFFVILFCIFVVAQQAQRFASMATSGFSFGKSAAEWNVLLYL